MPLPHISRALALILDSHTLQGAAYLSQLLCGLHQVSLDQGCWSTAALLLLVRDPVFNETFGATEKELEAVVGYGEAMKRIQKTGNPDGKSAGKGNQDGE